MVFGNKKKKVEPKEEVINEEEIIDMPDEEGSEELPVSVKKTAEELQLEIKKIKEQIAIEEKEEEAIIEEDVEEELTQQVPIIPQQPRVVIMDNRDLIRQTFSDVQALRVEVQQLRYIIEQEIAKE